MPAATCSRCSQRRPASYVVTLLMIVTRDHCMCITTFIWKDYQSSQKQWCFCVWEKSSKPEGKTLQLCNINILQPSPTKPLHNQIWIHQKLSIIHDHVITRLLMWLLQRKKTTPSLQLEVSAYSLLARAQNTPLLHTKKLDLQGHVSSQRLR